MASGILNRKIFMGTRGTGVNNKRIVFHDWAVVQTTIGSMMEPFQINCPHAGNANLPTELEFDDQIRKINEIIPYDHWAKALNHGDISDSDDGGLVHMGSQWFRNDVTSS